MPFVCSFGAGSNFHHLGEVSMLHVMHFFSTGFGVAFSVSTTPTDDVRLALAAAVAPDLRREVVSCGMVGVGDTEALVASSKRLAFLVVPVRVRSACL